jgi:hypothetical protein
MSNTDNIPTAAVSVSPERAAEVSGLGRTSIFLAIKAGRLRARKHGARTLILMDELERYVRSLPEREVAASGSAA